MTRKTQPDNNDSDESNDQPDPADRQPKPKKRPDKRPGSFNKKSRNIKRQQIRRPQHF